MFDSQDCNFCKKNYCAINNGTGCGAVDGAVRIQSRAILFSIKKILGQTIIGNFSSFLDFLNNSRLPPDVVKNCMLETFVLLAGLSVYDHG